MTKQDKGFRRKVWDILVLTQEWREADGVIHLQELTKEEAIDRIVSLVRELVPELDNKYVGSYYSTGFLDCRTEILSRLEEK